MQAFHSLRAVDTPPSGPRGMIVILAAFCLVIVIAFLAFAIDLGHINVTSSELQNAADAGALSGARRLSQGETAAKTAAKTWAERNVAANQNVAVVSAEDVRVGVWDESSATFTPSGGGSGSPNAVEVTCRRLTARGNALPLFIAPLLGHNTADLSATAIAMLEVKPQCGLIIGLEKCTLSGSSFTDSYNSTDGPYSSSTAGMHGHVCSNVDIRMSGSTAIHGNAHPGPGYNVISSSSVGVLGSIEPLDEPLVFPPIDPGDAATNNNNDDIPFSFGGSNPYTGSDYKLSGGDHADLPPGTYYFGKFTLSGGSWVVISGPTKIYTTGDFTLSGGSLANTTQIPANLQILPMGAKCVISGGSDLYAVVYAPTAKVERSGESHYYGSIVGYELVLSGSGGIHADEALDPSLVGGGAASAVLVE